MDLQALTLTFDLPVLFSHRNVPIYGRSEPLQAPPRSLWSATALPAVEELDGKKTSVLMLFFLPFGRRFQKLLVY